MTTYNKFQNSKDLVAARGSVYLLRRYLL